MQALQYTNNTLHATQHQQHNDSNTIINNTMLRSLILWCDYKIGILSMLKQEQFFADIRTFSH